MPPSRVMARVTAQADIEDANIQINLQEPVVLEATSDPHVRERAVETNDENMMLFAVHIQCQFPGIVWSLALTKEGDSKPKYQTALHDPPVGITDSRGVGKDSGVVDFN